MIITKTPYRISFFGGGSDYPSWYRKNGGAVLSTTIDKYIYISCRYSPNYFKKKYRIVWRKIENVQKINQIVSIPVIASGGAGKLEHLVDAFSVGNADAVLAASIFHYGEFRISEAKEFLTNNGIKTRL